jgi:hypothetical protein
VCRRKKKGGMGEGNETQRIGLISTIVLFCFVVVVEVV